MKTLIALVLLTYGLGAHADFKLNVTDAAAPVSAIKSYALTSIDEFVMNNDGHGQLIVTGTMLPNNSNNGQWSVWISRQALQKAGISAYEFVTLLRANEAAGLPTLNIYYDVQSSNLRIVK